MREYSLDFYSTLVAMVAVLLLGRFLLARIKFLRDFDLPEPVVGGVFVCIAIFIGYKYFSVHIAFDESLKDPLMLAFFSSIGLSADFSSLKKGGRLLVLFLVIVTGLLFLQNIVGVGLALAMGVDPLVGLLGGSITMSGGHGTGSAWADMFAKSPYELSNAREAALAAATFGLVMGGLIGGPVARFLIRRHKLQTPHSSHSIDTNEQSTLASNFEAPQKERLITTASFLESLALIATCLLVGNFITQISTPTLRDQLGINIPTFVWCLFCGIILRNTLAALKIHHVFDREVSVLGNVSLALFLALSFLIIKIWQLADIALPLIVILVVQTLMMIAYAIFITFRFLGKDYDASVFAAGHCGFGLGAMPTAVVNMQAVTNHYGTSHAAFMIVPLVGAFFIDIINLLVIQGFLLLRIFPQPDPQASLESALESTHTLSPTLDSSVQALSSLAHAIVSVC